MSVNNDRHRSHCSLFKENDHVVVDVQANVAVGLILYGEAATENDQAVPRLPEFVVELRLHILCDVRVVRRAEALEALDYRDNGGLGHLSIHVVPLDPDFTIGCATIDLQRVPVVTGHNDGLSAIRAAYTISLHLRCYDFYHVTFYLLC